MLRVSYYFALLFALAAAAPSQGALLLQKPTISQTQIVFSYAGDLWSVSRAGGDAQRLTTGAGNESDPHFSPDGSMIAFTGEYDGNVDAYVIPSAGGIPKRLTYHPEADTAVGWTADGKRIVFRSTRSSFSRFGRLFTLPADGHGLPAEVPLPMAEEGAFSPDGSRLAYVPLARAFRVWKGYRGGRTTPIWIANLADSTVTKIPRENSNDFAPMWSGSKIYFLSDRDGPATLFSYDISSAKVAKLVRNEGFDIKSASLGPDAIVYEQFGEIHIYDLKSGRSRRVDIRVSGDLPEVRPRLERVSSQISTAGLSPSGARAVFEVHGEILTAPASKGSIRNLTNTPGVNERDPAWSPDGKSIAYFSDASGEYELHIRNQDGTGEPLRVKLGDRPTFYYKPVWSPDSRKVAYTTRLTLWYVDLDKQNPVCVASDTYDTPGHDLNPAWSPDSRWLAHTKLIKNHMRALFLYSATEGKTYQVSDGLSDVEFPVFDKNGKYLYFTASTNVGPTTAWLDMSSLGRNVSRSVYLMVLNKQDGNPLGPESDEEKGSERKDAAVNKVEPDPKSSSKENKPGEPKPIRIDLDGIDQRIVAMPISAANYSYLLPGKEGVIFLMEHPPGTGDQSSVNAVRKFDLKTRKLETLLESTRFFDVSRDGEKMMFTQGGNWSIASASGPPKSGEGQLKLDEMEVRVDPQAEWRQMYEEVWRIERDFFYDPGMHGFDIAAAKNRYDGFLNGIASRGDLTYLFQEMLGGISVGHMNVEGGTQPAVRRVRGGLLGATYTIENGRYRFARIYFGENWNPRLKAPLTQPGVNLAAGDYLLAVNGRELRESDNIYSFFEGTAGKSVVLRVGPDPSGAKSRDTTVIPTGDEFPLRNRAWIEENRRTVDRLSGGRLAYVYLPNTSDDGYESFNRYYFSQVGKEGAVIDDRFNSGGAMPDFIIDTLKRPLICFWHTREGEDFTTPQAQIFGPKAMLVNEYSASGGDGLAWMFRQQKVGPLIGKRTWGGLVGIFSFPALMDSGFVTSPNLAFYSPNADWEVENRGVAPDIEVEWDPAAARAGRDLQLEKSVEVLLAELGKQQAPAYKRPAYPNYSRPVSTGTHQN